MNHLRLTAAAMALSTCTAAHAQADQSDAIPVDAAERTAAASETRTPVKSRLIEEIIVTAQKREENLQDVPISINAFSAETLDARGISDPKDLPLATPGLTIGSQAGFTITYLRGVGSDAFLAADPSIALYIDGVYFPFSHGQAQNFGSVERIEVLKGPQGTLFGRNAVGGAINITTQVPQFDAAHVSLQTSYSEYDNVQSRVNLNLPLADNLAIGVSGIYNIEDNYREDARAAGKPLEDEMSRGARVRLRWAPLENLEMVLSGFRLEQRGVSTMFATNSEPQGLGIAIPPQTGRGGTVDASPYLSINNTVFYGHAALNTDWFDIKLLGSDQQLNTDSLYDFDGSPLPLVFFQAVQFADVQTAELQILSNADSWGSDWLTWVGGAYYFKGSQGLRPVKFGVAGSVLGALNGLVENLTGGALPGPLPADGLLYAYGITDTDSNSLFAQATASITDWFSLTLGARYQEEKRTINRSGGTANVSPLLPEIPYQNYEGDNDTTKSFVPKLSLDFRPWEDGLVYLSYSEAVKSSTFNVVNFIPLDGPEFVKPEELKAYELGLKTTLFDGTTRFSSAAFYYDIKDIQVLFVSLLAGGALSFENAQAAEVKGIDFDLTSEIFPSVISGLIFTAGGAWVDARYTKYTGARGYNALGLYTLDNDYSGKRIVRSPKFSGTVGLSQTFGVPGGSLEVGADYYYNSGFYYLAQNTSFNEENAYGVVGARISYLYEPWKLRTTVFGKNINNAKYNYSRFTNDFGGLDALAPPAVYGVRLNWEF